MEDQPQVQYIPVATVPQQEKRGRKTRGPNRVIRPVIEQPSDPFIRYIPLTRGFIAIVDALLYDWLRKWNWYACGDAENGFYAVREEASFGVARAIKMHAQIIGFKPGEKRKVDHHDRNTMNNTGGNLRYATDYQSSGNKGPARRNKSGYKGVCWYPNLSKWLSQIQVKGKNHNLGYYVVKEDAARAYDAAALKYFGEFAYQNFPNEVVA